MNVFLMSRGVITFVCLTVSAAMAHAQESVAGHWEGRVEIPGRNLRLIVDLQENEGWKGSVTIPGLNVKGAQLSDVLLGDSELRFAVKGALTGSGLEPPRFAMRFAATGKLAGEFSQAGNTAPVQLEKTGPPQVEVPRRSTAIAPNLEGEWNGEYELFGYARKVTIKLTNRGGSGAAAEFVIVGKKVNSLPVDLVTQEGNLLTVDSRETGFSYEGRLVNGELRGALTQSSVALPLVLKRAK